MMDEISVLDYLKFKLNPKNFGKEILPEENPEFSEEGESSSDPVFQRSHRTALPVNWLAGRELVKVRMNPLFLVLCVFFALAAQVVLEPTIVARTRIVPRIGGGLYVLSALCFVFSLLVKDGAEDDEDEDIQQDPEEDNLPDGDRIPETAGAVSASGIEYAEISEADMLPEIPQLAEETDPGPCEDADGPLFDSGIHPEFFCLSTVFALLAFLFFGGNRFTFLNVSLWILSLVCGVLAFLPCGFRDMGRNIQHCFEDIRARHFSFRFRLGAWNFLWLAVFAVCAFFLFYRLDSVPMDMVSDHAEKLFDIKDILDGKSPVFFTRNTGRECFQFYFTVLIIKLFGTGLSFLSLKIGTALAGLFILPFIYRLGKMLGNRWVGLSAMLLAGISYWPVVIGRAALRFAYYPMFTAPAFYYLIRGLKERRRGDLIRSGVFLGIGLHGYSPFRVVPLAFVLFFIIYLLMDVKPGKRMNAFYAFLSLAFFAFLVFLPLARVTVDMPDMVMYRAVSRLGETEKRFDASPLKIFAENAWKGIVMPFWDDGSTWVHSIMYRPALEHLTASFFFLGLLFFVLRIIRQKQWEDVCMILAVPLFMLPSTLSLAFPAENPCLNRTAGAIIPVMLIAAAGICCSFDVLGRAAARNAGAFAALCAVFVLILVNIVSHNYDLIFRRYAFEYDRSAWNTTQIGKVIEGFANSIGTYDDAYVIPYPHWVDTRLVGINAGDPGKDYSFDKSLVGSLPHDGHPRLFIYRDIDTEAAEAVRSRYPDGVEQMHAGPYNGKNFFSYITFSSGPAGN